MTGANPNYYKITLPVKASSTDPFVLSGTLSTTRATGLINFKAALGAAKEVTQMYMGDLHGNLWKLDFSLLGTSDWIARKLSPFSTGTTPTNVPYPLYVAKDSSGNTQPITMSPSIAFGPTPNTSYIVFGTGKYLEASDKTSTAQQSAYMVFDTDSTSGDTLVSPAVRESAISGRPRLKAGSVHTSTGVVSVPAFTLGRAATDINTEVIRSGWYFDYPTSGERQISSATIVATTAIFGSLIPGTSTTTASCGPPNGGGKQYIVNIANGNGTSANSTVGIQGEPLVAEVTGATTYTISDSTGRRTRTTTSQIIQQGSTGLAVGNTVSTTVIAGRLSWRQINNYQDLKAAP